MMTNPLTQLEIDLNTLQSTLSHGYTVDRIEQEVLPPFLKKARWFGGKARSLHHVRILEAHYMLSHKEETVYLLLLNVFYQDETVEVYQVPFAYTTKNIEILKTRFPQAMIGSYLYAGEEGVFYDAVYSEAYRKYLWEMLVHQQVITTTHGNIYFESNALFAQHITTHKGIIPTSTVLAVEQSNTTINYGDAFFLKLYRKLANTINPDIEINRFFVEKTSFKNTAAFAGSIELKGANSECIVLAMVQEMVINKGNGWAVLSTEVENFYTKVLALPTTLQKQLPNTWNLHTLKDNAIPTDLQELLGKTVCDTITLLGKRTAEMHIALASQPTIADFAPEKFTMEYQNYLYNHLTGHINDKLNFLQTICTSLPTTIQTDVDKILHAKDKILAVFEPLKTVPICAMRTRIHGDYQVGQLLFTGTDFVIIDFEGEPATPITERKAKYAVFKDVAGMIRSFQYVAHAPRIQQATFKNRDTTMLTLWAETWYLCIRDCFLESYLTTLGASELVPRDKKSMQLLLTIYLMEKAMYEVCYEVNNRPTWLPIPLYGVVKLIADEYV